MSKLYHKIKKLTVIISYDMMCYMLTNFLINIFVLDITINSICIKYQFTLHINIITYQYDAFMIHDNIFNKLHSSFIFRGVFILITDIIFIKFYWYISYVYNLTYDIFKLICMYIK